ncbi:MAG: hypothetical protein COV10_00315 [Candidatus Vogelbacteria bacterium CG10_big_fil_rev_8_21_14_0_10_51_16]|uniref:Methyltransferase type 11 domain-containing protein n=1 Tax=Candidatus Vogelbacteria bacterium CG10_big_fil_rev_8_21_14_0_10_51_16 TaxID=1975045 RepID=A0A2H0RFR9_9BACT|nr:MAG: hypothetical protein COV10_00315 [Candidatus Vogelbacteria bacterium CG10_big_fil_rev_8_21_14_0_10_51_16]
MGYIPKFFRLVRRFGLRKAIYRSVVFLWTDKEDTVYGDYKRKHFVGITGDIVEIGVGQGANFAYYHNVGTITLVEPDVIDRPELDAKIKALQAKEVVVLEKQFEAVALAPASTDVVMATLVFCSVADSIRFLDKIHRALKTGGRFYFLEHIQAKTFLRRLLQYAVNPFWFFVSGSCQCVKATDRLFAADPRFKVISQEHFCIKDGFPWVRDHVIGVLEKKEVDDQGEGGVVYSKQACKIIYT